MLVGFDLLFHRLGELGYGPNGTPTAAHSVVATPWNIITIPRRRALLCTAVDTPFNPSNYGF